MRPERPDTPPPKIAVHASRQSEKVVPREFPGPRHVDVALRVAVARSAYAELIAHAKESLDAEVCGVLVGQHCADNIGRFVEVEAIIRGSAAAGGATHVTFTQATWDAIHAALEQNYPKARIVGWYHTHPGFGVEFSEMDLFIQKNFFAGAGQIALVTDPMSGAVAIAMNGSDGVEYLPRFWVDGREQIAKAPATPALGSLSRATRTGETADLADTLKALEARVSQLIEAHDQQRTHFLRFLHTVGFMVCIALVTAVSYFIYSQYTSRLEPPRLNNFVPVPIRIGDKTVMIGVGVAQWDVPPELNALMLQLAKRDRDAAGLLGVDSGPLPAKPDSHHEDGENGTTPATNSSQKKLPSP